MSAGGVGIGGRVADEAGVALVVVLWLLVVLGVLAAELAADARFGATAVRNERCRLVAHYGARAGVSDAAERLRRQSLAWGVPEPADPGRWFRAGRPPEDRSVILALDGRVGESSYRVVGLDISSRLNVNLAGEARLRTLLQEAGLAADLAVRLTHAIMDWMDADDLRRAHGAEAPEYLRLDRERLPRNGPVESIGELVHVLGVTPELLFDGEEGSAEPGTRGLSRLLTTRGSGRINLNTAPPEVLATLPGFGPTVVAVVLAHRRERPILSLDEVLGDPRLAGDPFLRAAGERLSRTVLTGLATEGVALTATAVASGCRVGARVEAQLAVLPGRVVIGPWREGWDSPSSVD